MVQLEVKTDVEFDFEAFVHKELLPEIEKCGAAVNTFGLASSFGKGADPKRRTVVCRHWLVGLCQKVRGCELCFGACCVVHGILCDWVDRCLTIIIALIIIIVQCVRG